MRLGVSFFVWGFDRSVRAEQPADMKQEVNIESIFVSPGHNYFGRHGQESQKHEITLVDEIECVAGQGIRGDRFFGFKEDYKGQITFFDVAVWKRLEGLLGKELKPSAFRRNVLLSGIDLNDLIGRTFWLDGVEFAGTEECRPCYWMDEACAPGAEDALKGHGGLRARILTDGSLSIGPKILQMNE